MLPSEEWSTVKFARERIQRIVNRGYKETMMLIRKSPAKAKSRDSSIDSEEETAKK